MEENEQQEQVITADGVVGQEKKKGKSLKVILSLLIVLVLLGASGGGYWYYQDKQKQEEAINNYHDELKSAAMMMLSVGADSEDICNKYADVWRDAIDSEYGIIVNGKKAKDFNEALVIVMEKYEFERKEINNDIERAKEKMKLLNQPPEGFEKSYDVAMKLFTAASEYADQAESPTGSLTTFNSARSELSSSVSNLYEEFNVILPESDS
jgi:hypothetical protein